MLQCVRWNWVPGALKKKNEKGVDNQMTWERRGVQYTQELRQAGKSLKIQFLQLMKKTISEVQGKWFSDASLMVSLFVVFLFRIIKKVISRFSQMFWLGDQNRDKAFPALTPGPRRGPAPSAPGAAHFQLGAAQKGRSQPPWEKRAWDQSAGAARVSRGAWT